MQPADLYNELNVAGVSQESLVRFDEDPTHRHVRYLDLLGPTNSNEATLPDAVVESAGQPYLYVVRRDRLGDVDRDQSRLTRLIRILACRSDARFLAVVRPGRIDVYPVGLFVDLPQPTFHGDQATGQPHALRDLLSGAVVDSPTGQSRSSHVANQWLEALLLKLLTIAAQGIRQAAPVLSKQQVIALVGRALFFRFLVDRGMVTERDTPVISKDAPSLVEMFSTEVHLVNVCLWMDRTFNGDLLSLGDKDYHWLLALTGDRRTEICRHLSNIQHRAVDGQLLLEWVGIEFRHVPIDLLSQVYEAFAHEFIPELARTTSIHFTPRRLAEVVLDGAFGAVQSAQPHEARVLDPAVGGGVFLVLALRRLVAERWRVQGLRPNRAMIRKILMTQLTGFDVNRDALNISALSLYLAALELDPRPSPLTDLKFQKLMGTVLHPVDPLALGSGTDDVLLGSLAASVLDGFDRRFDIVVGNPPWTGLKGAGAQALNKVMGRIVAATAGPHRDSKPAGAETRTRYGAPDIAFLLAATRWAKPKGGLGFVLHARFMFQPESFNLRRHVFSTIRVTGVMNFTALRQDPQLWPSNDAPFALLVARNEPAAQGDSFYFISPKYEPQLSMVGQFRIDPCAATPVPIDMVQDEPFALKALFKGGSLGFDLLRRLRSEAGSTVGDLVSEHGLKFKSGYQLGKPEQHKQDARHMLDLPVVRPEMAFGPNDGQVERFSYQKVQWVRKPENFRGPLLLFRESPRVDRSLRGALFCDVDVAYSDSFFGVSIAGRPDLQSLLELLYVVSYSDLFLYHLLLTSPKFGVERPSLQQADLEQFPLVRPAVLTEQQRTAVRTLALRLTRV